MKKSLFTLGVLAALFAFGCTDDTKKNQEEEPVCNDGVLQVGEDCDGTLFAYGKKTCETAVCTNTCTVDASSCQSEPETDACKDFTVRCDENTLVTCNPEDGSEVKTECKDDTPVCDAAKKSCVASGETTEDLCKDFTVRCDENTLVTCNSEDGSEVKTECKDDTPVCDAAKKSCVKEETTEDLCKDFTVRCDENTLVTCNSEDGSEVKTVCKDDTPVCDATRKSCVKEETTPSKCGNGVLDLDDGEECDKDAFLDNDDKSCHAWMSKYSKGNISCTADCKVDVSACSEPVEVESCKDAVTLSICIDDECDIENCAESGMVCKETTEGGKKTAECKESEEAPKCGDGIVNGDEECDGTTFMAGETSCKAWNTIYSSGNVTCDKATCKVKFDACEAETVEKCEGNIYKWCVGTDCEQEDCAEKSQICMTSTKDGYVSAGCVDDPSLVPEDGCGNGNKEADEQCDPGNALLPAMIPYGVTCSSKWSTSEYELLGDITCSNECKLSSANCYKSTEVEKEAYKMSIKSTADITAMVKNKVIELRGGFDPSMATESTSDNGWTLGKWPTGSTPAWDTNYVHFNISNPSVAVLSSNASASIRFKVKNNGKGPKAIQLAFYNGEKRVATSSKITVTNTYTDVTVPVIKVSQYPDFSFRLTGFSATEANGTITLDEISVWTSEKK